MGELGIVMVKEFVEKFWTQKVPFKLGLLTASAIDTRPPDGQTGSVVKRPVVGNDADVVKVAVVPETATCFSDPSDRLHIASTTESPKTT